MFKLAAFLTERSAADWSMDRLCQAVDSLERQVVTLEPAVPVHLVYWTAAPASDGMMAFHRDLYDVDGATFEALEEPELPGTSAP